MDARASSTPLPAPAPQLTPANTRDVFVVEDDPIIARLVGHLLTRGGYKVHHAADGLRAQAMLTSSPCPAVVVMDVMLPYVSGFELISQIRKTPGWERVPVIVLTSKSQESDILRAFDSGVNDYVVKPFRPEELVARVRRLAEGWRAA
ncbi:MAG TPA: response regulator transcription factor [Vicinamibacterales bacterium]|nr:response regulator transcription factor [Vicinamibacterales bacterium]